MAFVYNGNNSITTINYEEPGVWTPTSDIGITIPLEYDINPGSACIFTTGAIYEDASGDKFYCIGATDTEVRILNNNTTIVYVKVLVNFDEQGGSSVSNQHAYYDSTYGTLPTPTRTGYTFDGWFTASSGGTQITSGTTVTTTSINQTLYAQWTQDSTPIPTTRIGAFDGSPGTDATWRTFSLSDLNSTYNGRTARLVLIYRTALSGTTFRGDLQIDRIRWGGQTFDMSTDEAWRKDTTVALSTVGSYACRLYSTNALIGTSIASQFWSRDPNNTGSSGTGSALPNYGGYSLYAETSGSSLGDYFWCMSPTFTYSASATKDIIIAAEGNACGILTVYVVDNDTTDFTPSFANPTPIYVTGPTTWEFISVATSAPGSADVQVNNSFVQTQSAAASVLESNYPVANQNFGDIGVVFNGTDYYTFEAQ